MKKYALILVLLVASLSYGQGLIIKHWDLGTVTNSLDESRRTLSFYQEAKNAGFNVVDSIVFGLHATNETDIDSFDVYLGIQQGGVDDWSTTAITHTVTLNVAASSEDYERLLVSGAAGVTAGAVRGYNSLQFLTRGAAAGNDPTDPNKLIVVAFIYCH